MARKKRRIRKRSHAAQMKASFAEYSHQKWMNDMIRYENHKEVQSAHAKRVSEIEKDMLSRTLFVTGVRDLRHDVNLSKLEQFFVTNFGPVEECFKTTYSKRKQKYGKSHTVYPPARVRFKYQDDCQKALIQAGCNYKSELLLYCPTVGTIKGSFIRVSQSTKYDNMSKEILEKTFVNFTALSIRLGHFTLKDAFEDWQTFDSNDLESNLGSLKLDQNLGIPEFLEEEVYHSGILLSVSMNLTDRHIQLTAGCCEAIFRFKDIDGSIELFRGMTHHTYSLIFNIKQPPKLYEVGDTPDDKERCHSFGSLSGDGFGRCLSILIDVNQAAIETLERSNISKQLEKSGLFPSTIYDNPFNYPIYTNKVIGSQHSNNVLACSMKELHEADPRLGFTMASILGQCRFSWYHALNDVNLDHKGVLRTIFSVVKQYQPAASYEALLRLAKSYGRTKFPCRLFLKIVDVDVEEAKLPEHCVSIPRLLLTPCRTIVSGFEAETSNRVIRKFIEEKGFSSSSFVRLSIGDEDGQRIFGNEISLYLSSRIESAIKSGINVNGRTYLFLAYSSSQLKEASVWMVAPEGRWTVPKMRGTMGDFSKCKSASKYAARIGQCFSTTYQGFRDNQEKPSIKKSSLQYMEVEDVLSDFENVPHSDGNGIISNEAMTRLLQSLPNVNSDKLANTSVVQIRYGGAKGVLVAWDSKVIRNKIGFWRSGCDVLLRPSMIKFDAPYLFLEVCRLGTMVPYYLNRNVVFLLGIHGVPDDIFLRKQREMLNELESMLLSRDDALQILPKLGGADSKQKARLMHCLYAGMCPESDPFLYCCLLAIRSHSIFGLRKKTRILEEQGAVLIGGMDETKLLPEFCVFVQLAKSRSNGINMADDSNVEVFEPLVGPVMVTKHPVMHPGDVRMLLAVDIKELRGHKNVLLFSQHGQRPESNKMAGSDLDGDEYAVTWNSDLFLNEWNGVQKEKNGIYISKEGNKLTFANISNDERILQMANTDPLMDTVSAVSETDSSLDDTALIRHFINFAKNDCLGRISMLWQDWAAKYNAKCPECITLAGLHSTAVDFAKSGIPAAIPEKVKWTESVGHWRERKKGRGTHKCNSIVGRLYDEVVDHGKQKLHLDGLAGRKVDKYGQVLTILERSCKPYLMKHYQARIPAKLGWLLGANPEQDELLSFANDQRLFFEDRIHQIMSKYNLRNEGELFTGCIRKFNKLHKKRQHEFAEEVRRQCETLCDEFRTNFFQHVVHLVDPNKIYFHYATIDVDSEGKVRNDDDDDGNEEVDKEDIQIIEKILRDGKIEDQSHPLLPIIRRKGRQLAASYYISTYDPSRELYRNKSALFSFPWVIADVIAYGVNRPSDNDDDE